MGQPTKTNLLSPSVLCQNNKLTPNPLPHSRKQNHRRNRRLQSTLAIPNASQSDLAILRRTLQSALAVLLAPAAARLIPLVFITPPPPNLRLCIHAAIGDRRETACHWAPRSPHHLQGEIANRDNSTSSHHRRPFLRLTMSPPSTPVVPRCSMILCMVSDSCSCGPRQGEPGQEIST